MNSTLQLEIAAYQLADFAVMASNHIDPHGKKFLEDFKITAHEDESFTIWILDPSLGAVPYEVANFSDAREKFMHALNVWNIRFSLNSFKGVEVATN